MINAKELIIGHFEGTLTSDESHHLDELLASSPDVRAAFEQQRAIEEGMVEDSEALVPPIGLREATIAAALGGALTTTVGGGITAWLGSKAAAIIGTVALGGLVVGGIVLMEDDEQADVLAPATQIEQVQGDERMLEPMGDPDETTSSAATDPSDTEVDRPVQSSASRGSGSQGNEGRVSPRGPNRQTNMSTTTEDGGDPAPDDTQQIRLDTDPEVLMPDSTNPTIQTN